MNIFFKGLGVLFALLFVVGAAVQYNDPDSLQWIVIYILAAIGSLVFVFNKLRFAVALLVAAVCFVGFVYLYPENFQGFDLNDGDIKTVELGREAFGLLIIGIVYFIYAVRMRISLKV